jgi:predicted ATPase
MLQNSGAEDSHGKLRRSGSDNLISSDELHTKYYLLRQFSTMSLSVPCTVFTGFLGSGKTTIILCMASYR